MNAPPINTPHLRIVCFTTKSILIDHLATTLRQAICDNNGERALMLSGGSTPFPAYNQLANHPPQPSGKLHLFFSDERYVPLTDAQSNYRGTKPLIESLGLPPGQVHTPQPGLPLKRCAADYHKRMTTLLDQGVKMPLGILGLGDDGHTAGLFSPSDLARDADQLATWTHRPDGLDGITVTPRLLRRVEKLVFIVAGRNKREQLTNLIRRPQTVTAGQAVTGHPSTELWCDEEAWPV